MIQSEAKSMISLAESRTVMAAPRIRHLFWMTAAAIGLILTAVSQAQFRPGPADMTSIVATDGTAAGDKVRVALLVRLPEGLHANSNAPRDPTLIPMTLHVEVPDGITVEEIVWPEPIDLEQEGSPLPLAVFERDFMIGVLFHVRAAVAPGDHAIGASLRYQACDDKMCYIPATVRAEWPLRLVPAGTPVTARHADVFDRIPFGRGERPPETAVTVVTAAPRETEGHDPGDTDVFAMLDGFDVRGSPAGGYLGAADFLRFIENAEAGVVETGWFERRGPLTILAIVLIGGLALNLTPCVLPLIPINLAIIGAGARAGSRLRGLLLGGVYGAAMAVVYGVLGLIVILTASTFGAINASPWFNAGIAVLFVALALAMFDVITIDFSRFSSRFQVTEGGRGTFVLAFTMGAVAALLAGACVAPVVIQVVLFSSSLYASGTSLALVLPFLLGVGMAIPWPIAGAGLAALPKPGPWMVRVKQAIGIFILATAMYYGYTAYGIFANRWVDAAAVASSVQAKLSEGWHASLETGLAEAARDGKPVLIDFWATWCKNCLVMDRTTLADPDVTAALADYVKIKVQTENPDQAPASDLLARFGAVGLPHYVILAPRAR